MLRRGAKKDCRSVSSNTDSKMNPDSGGQKKTALLGLVLVCSFLVYANTLFHGFVYDDHFQVEGNPYVHSFRYIGRIFTTTVWSFQGMEGQSNYYRPLMTFGYLLCDRVFQSFPLGFHLVNLLLNCAVVWLVFRVCAALFHDQTVALGAAALFALHPIHSEVVAWIAAVTELQLAIFYLLGFLLYLRLGREGAKRPVVTRALMCASYGLALLSKEQGITLALMATIYEHVYREDRGTSGWKTKVSRYGPLWVMAALYVLFRVTVLRAFAPVAQRAELSVAQVIFSGLALVGRYAAKLFWPHPLLGFYVFHETGGLSDVRVLGGIAVIFISCALFVFLWKRAQPYSFALVWMAVTILPVLNVRWMAASAFAERYLYLPSLGFSALLAGAGVWLWRRADSLAAIRYAGAAAALGIAAMACTQIVARNRDWRDDQSFFAATLAADPHASYMRTSLGALEWSGYKPEAAIRDWQMAVADKPDNAIALSNLGMAMVEQKRWQEAEAYLRRAIELRPRFAAPHLHLGKMYAELGRPAEAEKQFRRAVEISPLNAEGRNQLARFLLTEGRSEEAEEQYRASLEGSSNAEAWDGLGDILVARGRREASAVCWQKALELSPYDEHAHLELGGVYQARGSAGEAEREYRAVLLLDPHNTAARKAMHGLKPAEFPEP
jgi:tetratricopeptide (TPR) repeat protein